MTHGYYLVYRRFLIVFCVVLSLVAFQSSYAMPNNRPGHFPTGPASIGVLASLAVLGSMFTAYYFGWDSDDGSSHKKNDVLEVTEPKMSDVPLISASRRTIVPQSHYLEYKLKNISDKTVDISEIDGLTADGVITVENLSSYPLSLAPDEECIIRLRVEISQIGKISQRISIGNSEKCYYSAPIEFSVVLDAELEVTKSPDIHVMHVGEEKNLDYTIKNTGTSDLEFAINDNLYSGLGLDSIKRDDTIQDNCGSSLLAGDSCNIRLVARPSFPKPISGKLELMDNFSDDKLISLPIEIEVKPELPNLDFTFEKISGNTNITTNLIGTTNFKTNKQVLEYSIKNSGNQEIGEVKVNIGGVEINSLSYPIRIDNKIKNSCSKSLKVGDSCTLRFIINPSRAIDIAEEITVVAKNKDYNEDKNEDDNSRNNEKHKKVGSIKVKAIYKPLLIIRDTEDKQNKIRVGEELGFTTVVIKNNKIKRREKEIGKDFKFTTPIVLHEINEDINAKIIVTGIDKGSVRWYRTDENNSFEWEVILYDEKPNDIYVKDNSVYVAGYEISVKYDWRRLWSTKRMPGAHGSGRAYGIREYGGKIFIAGTGGFQYLELEDMDKDDPCYNFCGPYRVSDGVKGKAYAVYIKGNNIGVGARGALYVSNDFGKKWNRYDENILGFSSDPLVETVCIDKNNIYAGTYKGLSISEDNGNTWKTYLEDYRIKMVYVKDEKVWAVPFTMPFKKNELFRKDKIFYSEDNGKNWRDYPLAFGDYSMIFFPVIDKDPITWKEEEIARLEESSKTNKELIDIILERQRKHEQQVKDLRTKKMLYKEYKDYEDRRKNCEILGIHRHEQDCSVVKEAYRNRSLICHPDRNRDNPLADQATSLINEAYNFLKQDCLDF